MQEPRPDVRLTTAGELWRQKDGLVNRERAAREWWAEAEDPEKFAATMLVRYSMIQLLGRIDQWMPAAVVPRDGDRLDVHFIVDLSDMNAERAAGMIDESVLELYAVKRLIALRHKLAGGNEESSDENAT